jgi:hypothetical protein
LDGSALTQPRSFACDSTHQYLRLIRATRSGADILTAIGDVPKRLRQSAGKFIGLRLPDHKVARALLAEPGEPDLLEWPLPTARRMRYQALINNQPAPDLLRLARLPSARGGQRA